MGEKIQGLLTLDFWWLWIPTLGSSEQREERNTIGSAHTGYWKFSGRCQQSTSLRNPPSPQLEYSSYDSWTALSIGRRYSTPFAASTFTELSICRQPAPANVSLHHFSSSPYFSLVQSTEYTECWPCPEFKIFLYKYYPAGWPGGR